jgi:hypothetical protein
MTLAGENRNTRTCRSAVLCTTYLKWTDLGLKSDLRGEGLMTNI